MDWRRGAWAVAGATTGVAAEWVAFRWVDVGSWLPDLVVGWTIMLCGTVARRHRRDSRTGDLLLACGFSWFVGNLAAVDQPTLAWIGAHGQYLHLAVLVQCILSFPTGRLDDAVDRGLVVASYARSLVVVVARLGQVTVVLGVLVVAVAARDRRGVVGPSRRSRTQALAAACVVGGVSALGAMARLVVDTPGTSVAVLAAYQAALCVAAIILASGLLRAPVEQAAITDLVVDLGSQPAGTLREALRRALGDPSVDVGYWVATEACYVDAGGRRLEVPTDRRDRMATRVDVGGSRLAVLVHDPAVLDDPGLLGAVARAARLGGANAGLQSALRAQVAEVAASRRRLVTVAVEQRRHLLARLRGGAEQELATVGATLAETVVAAGEAGLVGTSIDQVARAQQALDRALRDVHELARGLHPSILDRGGLPGALRELAAQRPMATDLSVPEGRFPPVVEAAVYFVCAEALTNIERHAAARTATIEVSASPGRLRLTVLDDGVGGAAVGADRGLRGLTDRVEALGGRMEVDSPAGGGTRLVVELPTAIATPGDRDGRARRPGP